MMTNLLETLFSKTMRKSYHESDEITTTTMVAADDSDQDDPDLPDDDDDLDDGEGEEDEDPRLALVAALQDALSDFDVLDVLIREEDENTTYYDVLLNGGITLSLTVTDLSPTDGAPAVPTLIVLTPDEAYADTLEDGALTDEGDLKPDQLPKDFLSDIVQKYSSNIDSTFESFSLIKGKPLGRKRKILSLRKRRDMHRNFLKY